MGHRECLDWPAALDIRSWQEGMGSGLVWREVLLSQATLNINEHQSILVAKNLGLFGTSQLLDCDVADAFIGVWVMADAIHIYSL